MESENYKFKPENLHPMDPSFCKSVNQSKKAKSQENQHYKLQPLRLFNPDTSYNTYFDQPGKRSSIKKNIDFNFLKNIFFQNAKNERNVANKKKLLMLKLMNRM